MKLEKRLNTPALFRTSSYTLSHDILCYLDANSLFRCRETCRMLMSSVADSLSPIMIRIIESSEFVSESAVGEIYKERKIKGNGTLRKVKSLSELNIDEMLDRLHEKSRSFTTDIAAKFHEKVRRIEERNFKTDVLSLIHISEPTRPY